MGHWREIRVLFPGSGGSLIWFAAVIDQKVSHDQEALPSTSIPRRGWIIAFTGFFLLIGAWSLATPYNGSPDEEEHVIRAAGVAAGQVVASPEAAVRGGGAFQTVPRSLVRDRCWQFDSHKPADCASEPGGDETAIRVGTGAGRYHPWYYAVVGLPLRVSPDWTGVLLSRLISAALCAALLAMALLDGMRWSRYRLVAAGVLATISPMAVSTGSAINPSGPEIAAGIAFFAAAVPLFAEKTAQRSQTLLWHAGVAGLTLVSLRTGGPLWFSVAIVCLLLPWRWATLRGLWAWRAARWWAFGIGFAMVVSFVWTELLKATYMGDFTRGRHLGTIETFFSEVDLERQYLDEMVGVTSWLDTRMPLLVYVVWQGVVAALVIGGFILATRLGRWRLAALAAGGLGIPFVMQFLWVNTYGFITQGRYMLPVAAGLPILGAYLIQRYGLAEEKSRSVLRICVVVLFPIHLFCLWYTMIRWQQGLNWKNGLRALNPLAGSWHPPLGSLVPLLACVAGALVVGWFVWNVASGRTPRWTPATPAVSSTADSESRGEPVAADPS